MKRNQLIILLVVAAVLGAVVLFLNRGEEQSWSGSSSSGSAAGAKVMELPINDVAHITVQTATGTANLLKKDDTWVVQERADYPASFERVSNLLRTVWDLKVVQEVNAGPSQFARFELADPPQGTAAKVEFKDKDGKQLGALLLGKKHMQRADSAMGGGDFPSGRYVMPPGGSRVLLVSEKFDAVEAKPESWLDREFVKVTNPSMIVLAGPTEAQKWKLIRESATAEWKLEGAGADEKPDSGKVAQVAGSLARLLFADVLGTNPSPAETGLDNPTTLTAETFDGFKYVFRIGKPMGENQPMTVEVSANLPTERAPAADEKPEDKARLDSEFAAQQKSLQEKLAREERMEGRVFLIATSALNQFVKDRAALLAENKTSPTATPVVVAPGVRAPPSVTTAPVAAPPAPNASTPTTSPSKRKR